jgi:hypothetical protein
MNAEHPILRKVIGIGMLSWTILDAIPLTDARRHVKAPTPSPVWSALADPTGHCGDGTKLDGWKQLFEIGLKGYVERGA